MMGTTLPFLAMGDTRLTNRCRQLINQFVKHPTASIPQACETWKTTKAAYRFFSNATVVAEDIVTAHYEETMQRIAETDGIVLVAQDTTDVDYTTHPATKGLGYLQGERLFGIKVHSALAISEAGVPLGLLAQTRWIRDIGTFGKRRMPSKEKRPIEEKESNRWLKTVREVEKQLPKGKRAVVIGDRESDMYELFAMQREKSIALLVRAKYNRYLWGTDKRLFEKVMEASIADTVAITVQRGKNRKERKTTVGIRYAQVTLASKKGFGALRVSVIAVVEEQPPVGVSAIRWMLVTTMPVTTAEQAGTIVQWYAKRWLIERFHYTLKSGCRIEELHLQEKNRLERAVALFSIVAWQLLFLTYEARVHPERVVTTILTEEEWNVLYIINKSKKVPSPTVHEAVRMLAKLGGFLARKGDKEPGVKTLWVGIRRFQDILYGWTMAQRKDVGNG